MDEIKALVMSLSPDQVKAITTGMVDLASLNADQRSYLVLRALNSCLNGPVASNTKHTVPGDNVFRSVSDIVGKRVNNTAWKAFCTMIAEILMERKDLAGIVAGCQMQQVCGGLWPIKDWLKR